VDGATSLRELLKDRVDKYPACRSARVGYTESVKVSLAGDGFIRWQSRGELPPHVRDALKSAKPEIVALLRRYALEATGALFSEADDLLVHLAKLGFRVRRYGDQAALNDDTGQGRVPSRLLIYEFADRQRGYRALLHVLQAQDMSRENGPSRSRPGHVGTAPTDKDRV
jgi:hypothetical protein